MAALACDQLREDGPLKTVFRSSSFLEVIHQQPHIISGTNMAILGVGLSYRQIFLPVHPFAAATTGPSQKHRPHRSRLCQHLQATISKSLPSQQHSNRSASWTIWAHLDKVSFSETATATIGTLTSHNGQQQCCYRSLPQLYYLATFELHLACYIILQHCWATLNGNTATLLLCAAIYISINLIVNSEEGGDFLYTYPFEMIFFIITLSSPYHHY